jgi:PAS domain S-box-containing protein
MRLSEFFISFGNIYEHPITLVDIDQPDQPLIYVNESFIRTTGFNNEEVLGRNCRFLQGVHTNPESVLEIRQHIRALLPCAQDLVNYRKDGSPFLNRVVLIPFNEDEKHYYVGLQHEIGKKIFKSKLNVDKSELLDKLINPLAILHTSVQLLKKKNEDVSHEAVKEKYSHSLSKIRDFILSL